VSHLSSEPEFFSLGSPLTFANKPVWGTCPGPVKPTLISPQSFTSGVLRTPEFVWTPTHLSTVYQLQVFKGVDPVMDAIVTDVLIADTSYVHANPLQGNTRFTWRVRGINERRTLNGESLKGDWSPAWSFQTLVDTSIDTKGTPHSFALHQNYPNPFNPNTQIQFFVPTSTHVRLEVVSISGQVVSVLMDHIVEMGTHSVSFDGTSLASGAYLYRLTTSTFTQTRTMHLIK
jgi:hypothetical protein